MRYKKIPVEIEAIQFKDIVRMNPIRKDYNSDEISSFVGSPLRTVTEPSDSPSGEVYLEIPTLEGVMRSSVGDYIIRGVKGEYYPCKPDIFKMTYEPVT